MSHNKPLETVGHALHLAHNTEIGKRAIHGAARRWWGPSPRWLPSSLPSRSWRPRSSWPAQPFMASGNCSTRKLCPP